MNKETFYKRELPETCIAFNSIEGKRLFRVAFDQGYLESYFELSLQFLTQSEPAYCGLGSLCMVLNAFQVDPMRLWKGVWRWFDEAMLDCCRSLEDVKQHGITLPEFHCLALCHSLEAKTFYADVSTKEQFRNDLKMSCKQPDVFMVVSYHRGTLGQTGDGHFSPIGGYNEEEDMVLILDVARFKYPAYWVKTDLLWESLFPLDSATKKSRGYTLLSRGSPYYLTSAFSQLSVTVESWPRLATILFKELPKKIQQLPSNTTEQDFLSLIISSIPPEYNSILGTRVNLFVPPLMRNEPSQAHACLRKCGYGEQPLEEYLQGLNDLLKQIVETELYHLVSSSLAVQKKLLEIEQVFSPPSSPLVRQYVRRESSVSLLSTHADDFAAFLTLFLFALFSYQPLYEHLSTLDLEVRIKALVSPTLHDIVKDEISLLRHQLDALSCYNK